VSELVDDGVVGTSAVVAVLAVEVTTDSSVVGNPPAAGAAFTPGAGAAATTEASVVGKGAFSAGEGDVLGEAAASAWVWFPLRFAFSSKLC